MMNDMARGRISNMQGRVKYSVVGRYMNGPEVTGYHLVGEDGGQRRVTKDELIVMTSRKSILNCRVQLYNGAPLLRGNGININKLPVYDENTGKYSRIDNRPMTTENKSRPVAMGEMYIIGRIMSKTSTIGYVVRDSGGIERKLSKEKVVELIKKKIIANATVQNYHNKPIVRGLGIDLTELPTISEEPNSDLSNDEKTIIMAWGRTIEKQYNGQKNAIPVYSKVYAESGLSEKQARIAIALLTKKGIINAERFIEGKKVAFTPKGKEIVRSLGINI